MRFKRWIRNRAKAWPIQFGTAAASSLRNGIEWP